MKSKSDGSEPSKETSPYLKKLANSFLKEVRKEYRLEDIGKRYLFNFCAFGFSKIFWERKKKGVVRPASVIGKKAFRDYQQRDTEKDYQIRGFTKEHELSVGDFERFTQRLNPETYDVVLPPTFHLPSEDYQRIKFLNDKNGLGFGNCVLTTTLFSPKSTVCARCNFSVSCQKLLKKKYPLLHRDRTEI